MNQSFICNPMEKSRLRKSTTPLVLNIIWIYGIHEKIEEDVQLKSQIIFLIKWIFNEFRY